MKQLEKKGKTFGDALFVDKRPLANSSSNTIQKIQITKIGKMLLFQHIHTKIGLRMRLQAHRLKQHLLMVVCQSKT